MAAVFGILAVVLAVPGFLIAMSAVRRSRGRSHR